MFIRAFDDARGNTKLKSRPEVWISEKNAYQAQ